MKYASRIEERLEKTAALEQEIVELESSCEGCEDISLIGVQVSSSQYGTGTIKSQNINRITVQFEQVLKTFILDKKYTARPRFENDNEIVEAFTVYGQAQEKITRIQEQIVRLQK